MGVVHTAPHIPARLQRAEETGREPAIPPEQLKSGYFVPVARAFRVIYTKHAVALCRLIAFTVIFFF